MDHRSDGDAKSQSFDVVDETILQGSRSDEIQWRYSATFRFLRGVVSENISPAQTRGQARGDLDEKARDILYASDEKVNPIIPLVPLTRVGLDRTNELKCLGLRLFSDGERCLDIGAQSSPDVRTNARPDLMETREL